MLNYVLEIVSTNSAKLRRKWWVEVKQFKSGTSPY